MVSPEMHSALTSRIYKNGVQTSASGAVSPNSQWSIPMFRAEFPHFGSKIVEHSRHLPVIPSLRTSVDRQAHSTVPSAAPHGYAARPNSAASSGRIVDSLVEW